MQDTAELLLRNSTASFLKIEEIQHPDFVSTKYWKFSIVAHICLLASFNIFLISLIFPV